MKYVAISSHTAPVNVVKLNNDGDLLFSASNDTKVIMYYSVSGERIGSFKCKAACKSMDITKDNKYLLTTTSIGHL